MPLDDCYIITKSAIAAGLTMSHHHHAEGVPHPSPSVTLSLLRLSVLQRLTGAGMLAALIWMALYWATR